MIRVLFGTAGWPSGLLEVGSWAAVQGLAQVVIRQIHPAKLCLLEQGAAEALRSGPLPKLLQQQLQKAELVVPEDAILVESAGGWILQGPDGGVYFYVLPRGGHAELFDPHRLAWDACIRAVQEYQERTGQKGRFLRNDQFRLSEESISAELWESLGAVGGAFIHRLITYRPHVIGFRLEGGDQEQVARFIRACRLFSRAEIVLGGPTATSHPREVLEDLGADYVFSGEAEETFVQFLRLAPQPHSRDLAVEISGLAYAYGGRTFHNRLPQDGYGRTAADLPRSAWMARGMCSASGGSGQNSGQKKEEKQTSFVQAEPVLLPRTEALRDRVQTTSGWGQSRAAERDSGWRNRVRPIVPSALLEANRLNWSLLEGFDRPMSSLFFTASRGCPGACTFCAKLHGSEVRWKSARRLLEEIADADACVQTGKLSVQRWPLFAYTDRADLQQLQVAWAAVYDEDFFLLRRRAVEFFRLWESSGLKTRYRLSFQTNPCSLLDQHDRVDAELLDWIDRLKPMIQLGGESFHPELLARWRKRHTVAELHRVAEALESTHQDYTVFILLSDFDSTPEEVLEGVRLLVMEALPRRRMRIASSPFTIPLYDSQTRWDLEYRGRLPPGLVRTYRDYERPHPDWMDPWAAHLADLADAELQFALQPAYRDAALVRAMEVVVETVRDWAEGVGKDSGPLWPQLGQDLSGGSERGGGGQPDGTAQSGLPQNQPLSRNRWQLLLQQAEWGLGQVREKVFQLPRPGQTERTFDTGPLRTEISGPSDPRQV